MNFILWLQNAIHLNLSFQQTQNGGIHTRTDVSQKCMEIQEMIVRYNFLQEHNSETPSQLSPRRKKNELRGKNKRKILSAAASSMCKLLPLPAQLTHYQLYLNRFVLYKDEKHLTKNQIWLGNAIYQKYTVRSRKKLNIG